MTPPDPHQMRMEAVRQMRAAAREIMDDLAQRGLDMENGAPALLAAALVIEARSEGMTDAEMIMRLTAMQRATAAHDPMRKAH